jgi:hypothetical protein
MKRVVLQSRVTPKIYLPYSTNPDTAAIFNTLIPYDIWKFNILNYFYKVKNIICFGTVFAYL